MNNSTKTSPSNIFDSMDNTIEPEKVLAAVYQRPSWSSYANDYLEYKEYVMPDNTEDDLDTLISWYVNRTKYKVRYAGVQLRKAFTGLPPVEQRKVGRVLLSGSKADVEWVCNRLDNKKYHWDKDWIVSWHPSYSDLLESAWVKYKSKYCGRLLIQFLDKSIVRKYLDDLLVDDKLYFNLCRRLVNEPWFPFDKERLARLTSINAYLSIMSRASELLTDEEARSLLYQWIGTIAVEYKEKFSRANDKHVFWSDMTEEHRIINAWGFSTALYYLLKMKKQNVIAEILAWDENVYQTFRRGIESEDDDYDNHDKFVDVVLENLPAEYRKFRYLNKKCFDFLVDIDKPFTKPRVNFLYKREAERQPAYFDSLEAKKKAEEPEKIIWEDIQDPLMTFFDNDGLSDLPY